MDPKAHLAQAIASAKAQAEESDSMPFPPDGYPALISIIGTTKIDSAAVLGYQLVTEIVRDCFGPDGKIRRPGDQGYREAQYGRLGVSPIPPGWKFKERTTKVLYALVDGNPILLEESAREIGYPSAVATSPNALKLGEIT